MSNSLSTADDLDGGAGSDSLYAELVPEFYGVTGDNTMDVQPDIQSVEDIRFEAMDVGTLAVDQAIFVDAKDITDVDKIGSAYSDADLVIENLTTLTSAGVARNTEEITITMDHTDNFNTDGDASDLNVYFDEDYLLNGEDTSGGQLLVRLLNAVQNEAGNNPVEGFSEITFTVGGTEVTVDISSIANDATLDYTTAYDQIVDAINAQLDADGFTTVTAALAPIEDAVFSIPVAGFSTGDDAGDYYPIAITNTSSEELAGVDIGTSALSYDTDLNNSFAATDPETTQNPVSVNVELEKVGRDGEGGDLVIGGKNDDGFGDTDVDQVDGIEQFNITVLGGEDKPSNLGTISSTNNYLETVYIDSAEPGQNDDDENTWADLTVRDQLGEGQELTLIDATDFEGDFSLAQNGAQQVITAKFGVGDDYMSWTSAEADGLSSDTDYSISMGAGDDALDVALDGDSVDAFGETFSVSMGSGDDELNITMAPGVSQVTMADLHTDADLHDKPEDYLEIMTESGDDTVNLAAYGNFNIDTDIGSDFVQINSIAGQGNGNANNGTWVIGPATSSQDTFGDRVLYKAQLTVSFAGFESTVDVDTDAQGNFVADQMTVNEAIIAAIDANHELTDLLEYELGTDSQQLTITSVVGGENPLAIALYQPEVLESDTDDDDLEGGQIKVSAGDLTALRQGLIDTTADTSADLELESDIVAAIDYGSIDQNGDGDSEIYAHIENDTVLDGVNDTNAAPDQDIFDLAGADLYLDYNDGGSTDATVGINFSTIDVGDGSNDIVVMHSNNDASSNVLQITDNFGKVSVLNFHNVQTDEVDSYTDVANHALDFTTYLTNEDDPSDVPTGNTQSVVPVPVTLNIVDGAEAFTDSGANPDATNTNDAVANGVNVLRFDENIDDPADLQTFEDLTADILLDALNDADDDGSTDYGNLDQDLLTPDDFNLNDLQSATQQHIVMVENDQNEGEYKVFHLTSSVDSDGNVDEESDGGVNQFATAVELGTLDFGASINFNLVGSEAYDELLEDLLDAADGVVAPNTAPVAEDDAAAFTVAQGESVVINAADLLTNDSDAEGDTLTITSVAQLNPADGTAVLSDDGSSITFTAAADFEGPANFGYTLSDGALTDTALVAGTVTAAAGNTAPVAEDDAAAFTVAQGESVVINVADLLTNDSDADGDTLTITSVAQLNPADGTAVLADDGLSITFTAAADFEGPADFGYMLSDGTLTDTAIVAGEVTAENGQVAVAVTAADDGTTYTAVDTAIETFTIENAASYVYNIEGFELGVDVIDMPDGTTNNNTALDGVAGLQWASDGVIVEVNLVGLTDAQDQALVTLAAWGDSLI